MKTLFYIVFIIGIVLVGISFVIAFWCGTRKFFLVVKGAIITAVMFMVGMALISIAMLNLIGISYDNGSNIGYCCGAEDEKNRIIESIEIINVDPVNGEVDIAVDGEVNKYLYNVDSELIEVISLGEFELTAYCPCSKCCGIYANGYTSTGAKATAGHTIAVDPKVIPYGTTVIINGHEYVASDCGGAIKGNRIDVFFDTHEEALQFGRQKGVQVYGYAKEWN